MRLAIAVLTVTAIGTACSGSGASKRSQPSVGRHSIVVTSSAFRTGEPLPAALGCDGDGGSPELEWHGVPAGTHVLALVVADPDAPGGTFYHWVVTDIPASTTDVSAGGTPRGGTVQQNSTGDASYTPPCPPSGTHRYHFTLYALRQRTGLDRASDVEDALDAIQATAIDEGTLIGTFSRD